MIERIWKSVENNIDVGFYDLSLYVQINFMVFTSEMDNATVIVLIWSHSAPMLEHSFFHHSFKAKGLGS